MRLQLLSDLHFESETYTPVPAPDAEVLVLAGDIDATWRGYDAFRGWPVPIVAVAGNHEFDRRELDDAWPALRERCAEVGIRLLECDEWTMTGRDGRTVRFLGTVRWSDYDLYGEARRAKAMRAGAYFLKLMQSTVGGVPLDPEAMRRVSLGCREWLAGALGVGPDGAGVAATTGATAPPVASRPAATPTAASAGDGRPADATVVITHFAPSLASADPRYGQQASTASFCNADDALLPAADLWLHGHLHAPCDYRVARGASGGTTRVVCNPRGQAKKNEPARHQPGLVLEV